MKRWEWWLGVAAVCCAVVAATVALRRPPGESPRIERAVEHEVAPAAPAPAPPDPKEVRLQELMEEYRVHKTEWLARGEEAFDAQRAALQLELDEFRATDPATKSAIAAEIAKLRARSSALLSRDKEAFKDRMRIQDEIRKLGIEPPTFADLKNTPPGR